MKHRIKVKKSYRKLPKKFLGGLTGNQGEDQSQVGSVMGDLGNVAGMIPGWGQFAQMGLGIVGSSFDADAQQKKALLDEKEGVIAAKKANEMGAFSNTPVGGGHLALGGDLLKQYDAPTHSNGGQTVDANGNPAAGNNGIAEIEKNETIKDGFAYSPNLVDPESQMSFAERSKKIESKYKKQMENGDDIARWTKKKELDKLKGTNESVKAEVQARQQEEMNAKLAPFLKAMQQQQAQQQQSQQQAPQEGELGMPQDMPQGAYGGKLKELANGGPIKDKTNVTGSEVIIPNSDIYSGNSFADTYSQLGSNTKAVQEAIAKYGSQTGQNYLPKHGVDELAGAETKGFFDTPANVKGLNTMLNKDSDVNNINPIFSPESRDTQQLAKMGLLTGGDGVIHSQDNPSIKGRNQTGDTPDKYGLAAADSVSTHEALKAKGLKGRDIATRIKDAMNQGNLVDKSGNIIPQSDLAGSETKGNLIPKGLADADTSEEGKNKKGKNGKFKEYMQKLADGELDTAIGTGLKGVEVAGSLFSALRPKELIDTQLNRRAREAEETLSKRGQSLTKARQDSSQALQGALGLGANAMSNAVKMAMGQKAYSDYGSRGVDIAAREKALTDQLAGQLGSMQSAHGTEDKIARDLQEVKQSQTNAVKADAIKSVFETTGNLGELMSKKGAISQKADEQFAIINQKYPNMKLGTRQEFAKAVAKGDIGDFVKFVKTQNVTMEEALKMADELPSAKSDKVKDKIAKEYSKTTKTTKKTK